MARVRRHVAAGDRHRADENYAGARDEYVRALAILERPPPKWQSPLRLLRWMQTAADGLVVLGEIDLERGFPDLARRSFEQALQRYADITHHESEAMSVVHNNLGVTYEKLGLHGESERALRKAMEIDRKIGRDPRAIAATLNNLALTLQAAGYPDDAAVALERAAALAGLEPGMMKQLDEERSFHLMARGGFSTALVRLTEQFHHAPENSVEAAHVAGNLAQAYAELQNPDEAQRWQRRAVAIRELRQPASLPLAVALHNLADTLGSTGQTAEAARLLDRAVALAEGIAPYSAELAAMRGAQVWQLLAAGDPAAAAALAERALAAVPTIGRQATGLRLALAIAYGKLNRPDLARTTLETARDICAKISPLLPELRWVQTMLGQVLFECGDTDAAARCFDRAIEVAETMRTGSADEPGLGRLFGTAKAAYHGRIWAASTSDTPEEAEVAFHAAESFRARTLAEMLVGAAPLGGETAKVLAELDGVRRQLGAVYRRIEVDPDPLQQARRDELEEKAEHLRIRLRTLAPSAADREYPRPCTVAEVQRHLDESATVAVYEVTDEAVFLFIVRRKWFTMTKLAADTVAVAAAVEEVVAACNDLESPPPDAALRRLGEWLLRPLAGQFGNLAVCAGDMLAHVPFEALELDGVALADLSAVWSIPSATVLTRFGADPGGRKPDRPFAGFAMPLTPGQVRLPGSVREVRTAAECLGAEPPATDAEVTVAAVRALAPSARYVHFAVHGLLRDDRPLYSGFPLSGDEFLHAYELAGLELSAELVVCSACESAKGESRAGEGTVGLAYALFSAGARAVLLSRWPIVDAVAVRYMRTLYRNLAAGVPPEQAVRDSALNMRRSQSHPREWAAFVLVSLSAGRGTG